MAEKPKILFVHHGRGIGGAPLTLLTLLKAVDRSKYDLLVLCMVESEASELFRRAGFRTEVLNGISLLPTPLFDWMKRTFRKVFPLGLVRLPARSSGVLRSGPARHSRAIEAGPEAPR